MDEPSVRHEIAAAAQQVISAEPDMVCAWQDGEPGSWGFFAGKVVLASKSRLGRPLSEGERRLAWQTMWDLLVATRA
ncbi:MAG: hypothetical protein WEB00_12460 [Dehalococcoidia bacterium]